MTHQLPPIGESELRARPPQPGLAIIFSSGRPTFRPIPLTDRPMALGRSRSCDVVVDDTGVSGRHLELHFQDGLVHARDLGGRNGTYLDAERFGEVTFEPSRIVTLGDTKLVDGLRSHFKGTKSITFGGKSYKPAELESVLQDNLDLSKASDAAKRAWIAALERANASEKKTAPVRSGLVSFVVALFGAINPELDDFGLRPKKARRTLTTEEVLHAIEKRTATRKARHTMGKRQKLDVVGVVPTASTDAGKPTDGASTNGSSTPHVEGAA